MAKRQRREVRPARKRTGCMSLELLLPAHLKIRSRFLKDLRLVTGKNWFQELLSDGVREASSEWERETTQSTLSFPKASGWEKQKSHKDNGRNSWERLLGRVGSGGASPPAQATRLRKKDPTMQQVT